MCKGNSLFFYSTVALVVSISALGPAQAASKQAQAATKQAQEKEARKACLNGDYSEGVSILSNLFVETKDTTYIYNQGRCFEQNLRYEEAIGRFQEYLRAGKKLSKADQADAQKHIADCKGLLASQPQAVVAAPAAVPTPVALTPVSAPTAEAAQTPIVQQTNPRPASESGSGLRTAGIVTASIGGAALVTGIILNIKVNSMASDMQKTNGYTDSKDSDRKTYETMGWVGYGVGAACVATGAVLYYLGARPGATSTASVAFVPAFAPGQAGAIVRGVF